MAAEGTKSKVDSPEFRAYFEAVVNSSKSLTEAKRRLGYNDAHTVRYYIRKFGMETPSLWFRGAPPRPSARGPAFRAYLEEVVKPSKDVHEATNRLGYASPTTVMHHMKRLGVKTPDHWYTRPLPNSPEFKSYFENIINTSESMSEAVKRLGYTRPQSIRYNLRRFGIKPPSQWYSHRDLRPSTKDPEFRAYLEKVLRESASLKEATERMDYGDPTSVKYHMSKLDIKNPDRWYEGMSRPRFGSPEWMPNFENVVKTSKNAREAASRLGYSHQNTVHYHMRRLGLQSPFEWSRWTLELGMYVQEKVPKVVIPALEGRVWVAGIIQGEGCIMCDYLKTSGTTYLVLAVCMTDPDAIIKLSGYCEVPRPRKAYLRGNYKPQWRKDLCGLRALRALREILPYLVGSKLREAERAISFFSPHGHHLGHFRAFDIWPPSEFPLRCRPRSIYNALKLN
jgi:AraC-like DNA-binding protein